MGSVPLKTSEIWGLSVPGWLHAQCSRIRGSVLPWHLPWWSLDSISWSITCNPYVEHTPLYKPFIKAVLKDRLYDACDSRNLEAFVDCADKPCSKLEA